LFAPLRYPTKQQGVIWLRRRQGILALAHGLSFLVQGWIPQTGVYLVMLSPIVFVVLVGLQRLNGRAFMHTDVETPQA